MASTRPMAGSVPVGSLAWIENERMTIEQLEAQELEEFAFAARNDLEWLNEHMADIFEHNTLDMAELMKTPGKLRGKTPRTVRKRADPGREALADIFAANQSPEAPESRFTQALTQLAKPDVSMPAPAPSPPKSSDKSPMAPPPAPSSLPKMSSHREHHNDTVEFHAHSKSFADSGFFSASQPNSQMDIPEHGYTRGQARVSDGSLTAEDVRTEPDVKEPNGRRIRSSGAMKEEEDMHKPEPEPELMEIEDVPTEAVAAPELEMIESVVPKYQSPIKPLPSPKKSTPAQRRSGRIASRRSSGEDRSREPSVAIESVTETYQETVRPSPRYQKDVAVNASFSTQDEPELEPTQKDDSDDEKSSSSRSPTPEVNIVRKSSMNFAPLPAREPLTSKRPMAGRDSHLENMRQPNTARASWMNKKSNGKSLGGSARPINPRNTEDEEMIDVEQKPSNDGDPSRRQQDVQEMDEVLIQETKETTKVPTKTGDEDVSEDERRRHTKANTKRLHDKIQQLGKLSVARPKSSASANEDPRYPSLGGMDMDVDPESPVPAPVKAHMESARHAYEQPIQPPAATFVERKDIVEHRPNSPRTRAEELARAQESLAHGNSPVLKPSPLRGEGHPKYPTVPSRDPLKSPIYGTPSRHHQDPEVSPDSSPFKHAPSSPLKNNASIYNSPHHSLEDLGSTPKKLFPAEGSYNQSKGHMATYLAKAKQLLARSGGTAVDARAAATNPVYDDGDVFRSEATSSYSYERPEKTTRKPYGEPVYPSLDKMPSMEYDDDTPASRTGSLKKSERPTRSPRSKFEETGYEHGTRQTRSSRARDEDLEEQSLPPRVTVKSKRDEEASIRAAQQERERRDQEQLLREREMLKKIQKEERRLAAMEEDRKRQAQAAAEERRRQQREAEEEERRRQEEEEYRRRQEEEEYRRRQEEEELRRLQEEELMRQQEEEKAALQKAAAEAEAQAAHEMELEQSESTRSQRERMGSVDPERPHSRVQKGSIRFRPSENKPPIRSKSQTRMRPAPVTIKIGTSSQMDQRRKEPTLGPTPGPSVAALKSAFEPPPRPDSRNTLQTQSSQGSIRSVTSQSNKVKSLQAAANARQREQEERERRELQRKDSERRRQEKKRQEEEQRKLEEQRRQQQRARTTTGTNAPKTLNRVPQIHNLRQPSEEPVHQPPPQSSKYGKLGFVKGGSIKRVMPIDNDDSQTSRAVPSRPGFPSFQQEGTKKRRTSDVDDVELYQPQSHKQPIRPSTVKNQLPQRTMPTHGYKSVNALSSGQTIKAVGSGSVTGPSRQIPHVDGVKYTTDKIHFAGESQTERPPREPRPGPAAPSAHFKTPATSKSSKYKSRPKTPSESPMYPNPDEVELPAILTDSEDEEEEYNNLPRWVESPYLREMLERQQDMDPAEIFGEVKPPDMEAMFKGSLDARRVERLRARTSSAHWGGPDGLTQEEMLRDLEERRKLHAQGHWTYPSGL